MARHRPGDVLSEQQEFREALALYLRALSIYERTLAPQHPRLGWVRQNQKESRQLALRARETFLAKGGRYGEQTAEIDRWLREAR